MNQTCPNCGYCPHCGRSAQPVNPYPVYPQYPVYPSYPYWQQPGYFYQGTTTGVATTVPYTLVFHGNL